MANDEDIAQLRQGVAVWNAWRRAQVRNRANLPGANIIEANLFRPNLSGADLHGASLMEANLKDADLHGANLVKADLATADLTNADLRFANVGEAFLAGAFLDGANLSGANLSGADLRWAYIQEANLSGADLSGADLGGTNLSGTNLSGACLRGADLSSAILIETNLTDVDLTGCHIYGISAWDLKLEGAKQRDLVITRRDQPEITVDNLEVGQFVYLLLRNEKIRDVIDTITSKVVLILGRFTLERKVVLDALREELRKRDYLPVLFDFDRPTSRDITETVSLLARMARFVVADITDARSIPQELMVIAPHLPSVPIQPLLQEGAGEYGMFEHFRRYPWVLEVHVYASPQQLTADLGERVIGPAEAKVRELRGSKSGTGAPALFP